MMARKASFTKGQAAVELAVFGAILIFILGTIVRTEVDNGYTQNQNFRATRMAMLASWEGTIGGPLRSNTGQGMAQNISRNNANILFVEDRLSPDFSKYGDLDRNPYISPGGATFTYNLFYPVDAGERGANVPVMDVFINGSHFSFTTAAYESDVTLTPPNCSGFANGSCKWQQCERESREWINGQKLFYRHVPNGDDQFNSCSGQDSALCGLTMLDANGAPYTNTNDSNGDLQFDLLRLGLYTGACSPNPTPATDPVECVFPPNSPLRQYIAWQWGATWGTDANSIGLDPSNEQYPAYDIDGRLKEVTIYDISSTPPAPNVPPSVTVSYEDSQAGDIDTTWDRTSCGPKPGLLPDSQIYTFTKDGTYLQILEGSLFNPETDQFVRSQNKRNTIDLIQRTLQLSNNTGRFCQNGTLCPQGGTLNGITCADANPVEVCIAPNSADNCFSSETNIKSTCYDENTNKIFVRSRLEDLRGHSWFTVVSGQLDVH